MYRSTRQTETRERKKIVHINYNLSGYTLGLNSDWIHIPLIDPVNIPHHSEVYLSQFWLNTTSTSPAFIVDIDQFPAWDSNDSTPKCGITVPATTGLAHYDNFFLFYTNPIRLDKISLKIGDSTGDHIPGSSNLIATLLFQSAESV
jgi:hypothetical protein